jgi:pimeloyl-ACP methyl ester carboxylesterase
MTDAAWTVDAQRAAFGRWPRSPTQELRMTDHRIGQFLAMRDGTRLFVKDHGRGPTVVFIHGWPFNADMWDHHAQVLGEGGFRTIAYDRRGFGRSDQPDSAFDYDVLAGDLEAVIDASGAPKVTLVGYSMGGGEIIRYLSSRGSSRVERIALVGTIVPGLARNDQNPEGIPETEFDGIRTALRTDRAGFIELLLRDVIYDVSNASTTAVTPALLEWSKAMAHQASLKALLACVDTFGRSDLRAELDAVDVPALILHGTNDKPVPHGITAEDAARRLRNARLVLYPNASHGLVVTERDRVTGDLLGFLRA